MAANRVLFRSADGDWDKPGRVILHHTKQPVRELERIAQAYQTIAHDRVEMLRAKRREIVVPEMDEAYPIVFLYRQAFELTLKAIIVTGAPALEDFGWDPLPMERVMRHPLTPLFEEVTRIFFSISGDNSADAWDLGVPELRNEEDFATIVREFDEIDSGSYTFRYSIKKDGVTPSLDKPLDFDLFEFADKMDRIIGALLGAPGWIREHLEFRAEMRYEARAAAYEEVEIAAYEGVEVDPADYD